MKKKILSLLFLPITSQADDLVKYRVMLDVNQRPVSIQETGFGGVQTNKANIHKIVSLAKESVISVFDETVTPSFGRYIDKDMNMRTDIVTWTKPINDVWRCPTDNLSWPFKSLKLGMTNREGADWVLLQGEFRSEKIYDNCLSEQKDHTYTQEVESISFKVKLDKNQIYTYTFTGTKIPTRLIIERID